MSTYISSASSKHEYLAGPLHKTITRSEKYTMNPLAYRMWCETLLMYLRVCLLTAFTFKTNLQLSTLSWLFALAGCFGDHAELHGPNGTIEINSIQYQNDMRCGWKIQVQKTEVLYYW